MCLIFCNIFIIYVYISFYFITIFNILAYLKNFYCLNKYYHYIIIIILYYYKKLINIFYKLQLLLIHIFIPCK